MRKFFYNEQHMLKLLIGTSILMFASILISITTTPKVMAVGMSLFMFNVGWIVYLLGRGRFGEMGAYHNQRIKDSESEGKYVQAGVYGAALPMCVLGILVIVINLVVLFFMEPLS
jgi:hypothetical protein